MNIKTNPNSNPNRKKNIFLGLCLISFLTISIVSSAQSSDVYLKTKVEKATDSSTNDGSIKVECYQGSSNYLFVLYDKMPIDLSDYIEKSDRIKINTYHFTNLKPGVYFVCVWDGNNEMVCDKVEVARK
jgi:hypothetical protein